MAKSKISGGASTNNSVVFFLKESEIGIKAIRKEGGTIVTKKVNGGNQAKDILKIQKIVVLLGLFREFAYLVSLPKCIYHIPTAFWGVIAVFAILYCITEPELRKYHGAEHMIDNWYNNKKRRHNVESIKMCSRIHLCCGTNLVGTIFLFQIISSICMTTMNIHIPEIITAIVPFYLYKVFPFNVFGILMQVVTTDKPEGQHIEVALTALTKVLQNENSLF